MANTELEGARVLVTGGAGFIGSHVVHALNARGVDVAVIDDLSSGHRENVPEGVKLHEVDVRDGAAVDAAFDEFRPTHVCHQAAQASVKVSVEKPGQDAAINILGGLNVLEAARRHHVARFVFASTGGAIYGEVPEGRAADEGWPARPKSPYAVSKAAFEHYLESYRQNFGLSGIVLRYANVYGPRQDPHGEAGVVAIFTQRLLDGQSVSIFARKDEGDPGCVRDYVYVGDVVGANLWALGVEDPGEAGDRVFNVGTGTASTTLELFEAIRAAAGSDVAPGYGPVREGDLEVSVLDASRLTALGWSAEAPLSSGIEETVRWFRARTEGA